ncbi:hypothetical protein [Microlunatus sp. Gsoil 973]|uniref:hypothetical protein n=1 Tax=Microlunatus sp. Gsoil 973 TaxID=2672569 RepID=UPI0012B4896B|nr:hypothetical protein [Microlunatus sp. Gsoil 973]QGN34511.1 hypothetical protein GJV80_18700 [Microlunatus sp. Gsoil 973]
MTAPGRPRGADAPPAGRRLGNQARSWIMVGMALALVLMYLSIWMTYAGTHTYERYRQLAPGETTTVDGVRYKLIKLTRTEVIVDGDETKPSQAGAVYVIAELEILTRKKDPVCSVELVGSSKRTWEAQTSFFDRELPQYCGDFDHPVTPGKPWRFEQVFLVPAKLADQLYGIAAPDRSSPAPVPVLTPVG